MSSFAPEVSRPAPIVPSARTGPAFSPAGTASLGLRRSSSESETTRPPAPRFTHDFGRISIHAAAPPVIQPKLRVDAPGDEFEREADHVADQVMRMPESRLQPGRARTNGTATAMAPPAVHDALRSPGHPLDAATRAFMEPRFGHDFSRVRIHADAGASGAASAIDARAFTHGRDIVFGTGEYAPRTEAGRRLLAHELTHVVQQERAAQGSAPSIQRKKPPTAGTAPDGDPPCQILYQNEHNAIAPQAEALDVATIEYNLDPLKIDRASVAGLDWPRIAQVLKDRGKKITAYEIDPTVKDPGQRGSLGYVLLMMVKGNIPDWLPWGSETDLAHQLYGPPAVDALVTVRVSCDGKASITLVSRSGAAVPAHEPGAAVAALKAEFSILDVTDDGTAQWGADELDKVLAAFRLVPETDRGAIAGIRLVRVKSLPGHDAHFEQARPGSVPSLAVSDTVFRGSTVGDVDAAGFVGGKQNPMPRSTQTILHEVGHAVAAWQLRQWEMDRDAAQGAIKLEDDKIGNSPRSTPERDKAVQELDAVIARRADVMISADALDSYTKKADAAKAAYDAALAAAQGTADAGGLQALTGWGAKMQALLDRPDLNPLFDDYKTWLAQRTGWGSDLTAAAAAQADWAKAAATLAYARGRTRRVQKFVEVVEAAKIEPFTPYARDNWPIRAGEFYAEAYSIWLADPEFLESNYKVLFDFFASGDFR